MEILSSPLAWLAAFLFALVASAFTTLFNEQVKASTPALAVWLVNHAVRRLPEELRSRYREEWLAMIADMPGPLFKLYSAVGCSIATGGLAREHERTLAAERNATEHSAAERSDERPADADNERKKRNLAQDPDALIKAYDLLGVKPKAKIHEIRVAWLRLVKELHPDNGLYDPSASERLKTINRAYQNLKSLEQREMALRAERRAFSGACATFVVFLLLPVAAALVVGMWTYALH